MTAAIDMPAFCAYMTQIGTRLVFCGWPREAHSTLPGRIADHEYVAPEPIAEAVP